MSFRAFYGVQGRSRGVIVNFRRVSVVSKRFHRCFDGIHETSRAYQDVSCGFRGFQEI